MDAKRTKRVRDADDGRSLDDLVGTRRSALVAARHAAPHLRTRAQVLRTQASALGARWQRRQVADMHLAAAELEEEAHTRESMSREHRFEAVVVSYLRMYHHNDSAPEPTRKNESIAAYARARESSTVRRANIIDEYRAEVDRAPAKVAMAARDECPRCTQKLLLCAAKAIMTCPECGYAVTYLDASTTATSFDEVVTLSQYSYKRINHFSMYLALVQGKEAHRVADDVVSAVMEDLYRRQGIVDAAEVTPKRVRDALRRLRLRRAYDHVVQVTARISGRKPNRLTPQMEEQLRTLFLQMQPAFQKHAPSSRTNFLSYPYVMYRLFQLLKLEHMLDSITLLKGRDKLEANDAIYTRMCSTLGWPVYALPPNESNTL